MKGSKFTLIRNSKEVKIQAPEGYEIDKENSTFDCVKLIKKDVCEKIFSNNVFYINYNDTNKKQLLNIIIVEVCFNNKEDAQVVIDNPNFREILDT